MAKFFLVLKAQKQILMEDNRWYEIDDFQDQTILPMVFGTIEAAKSYKKGSSLCKKIAIYNENILQEMYHIDYLKLEAKLLCKPSSSIDEPDIQDDDLDTDPHDEGISCQANVQETVETPLICEAEDLLSSLIAFIERVNTAKDGLPGELKSIDQILQDELHFSEFEKLNVVEGYKAWQRIHEARIERRRIKNEIEIVDLLASAFGSLSEPALQNIIYHIDRMKDRRYHPRSDQYPTTKIS